MLLSIAPSTLPKKTKLVVTYVSRQHAPKGRRLDPDHNDRLEAALKALEPEFEVNLVYFEEHSPAEQIRIAARTDVGPNSAEVRNVCAEQSYSSRSCLDSTAMVLLI